MATLGLAGPALIVAGRSAVALLSDIWANNRTGVAYFPSPENPKKFKLPEVGGEQWLAYVNKKLASRRAKYIE